MTVYKQLHVSEANHPTNEIYVVYTGKEYPLTEEQQEKCKEYLDFLNEERKKNGQKPIKNGDVYTIVNEQRTPDGKILLLTQKTNYAHFLAFRDQTHPKVKEIFGDVPIPPCPVANPQTLILPKPESVKAKEEEKGVLGRIRSATRSKGPQVILGVMGEQTAFEGVAQAFGAGLSEKNMSKGNPEEFRDHLRELGFKIYETDFAEGAGTWNLVTITNQALENQAGITEAGPVTQLGPVRDNVGNYYLPSLTPVNQTWREIINGKPEDSKFSRLISVPADPNKAEPYFSRIGIDYRVYIPPALERIRKLTRKRPGIRPQIAEKLGKHSRIKSSIERINPREIVGRIIEGIRDR